jgi:hypothetical protein
MSIVWPPKMNPRIGVISWNCPSTVTVTVLLASSGQPLLLQSTSMSVDATWTIEPFDSNWTRHTIRFVVVLHGWPPWYESGVLDAWKAPSRAALSSEMFA